MFNQLVERQGGYKVTAALACRRSKLLRARMLAGGLGPAMAARWTEPWKRG